MAKHYILAVHNLVGDRLCSLYDSDIEQEGSAQEIKITKEADGWKELEFTLNTRTSTGEENYRLDFLKNENRIYVTEDGEIDVYYIKAPAELHDKTRMSVTVSCSHISEELRAKNLYRYFDDTNGIDTCDYLIRAALKGSGWILNLCDTFYEADGTTEKVRSYSCDTKTGTYNMIAGICELFDARPVFHGYEKTVDIHSMSNTEGMMEINYGKNSDKIKRTLDSTSLVTRLYVEGEYGDYGYVGIDDVNPTGLPFILNFDYFKELGYFTTVHEEALAEYLIDYKAQVDNITGSTNEQLDTLEELNELIGTFRYVLYPIVNGNVDYDNLIAGTTTNKEDLDLDSDETVAIVQSNGSYEYHTFSGANYLTATCLIKFIPTITGKMAGQEDSIEAAQRAIESLLETINKYLRKNNVQETTVAELHTIYNTNDLSLVNNIDFDLSGVADIYKESTVISNVKSIGDKEKSIATLQSALYANMLRAIELMGEVENYEGIINSYNNTLDDIEDEFALVMGSMLRDGYWSDDQYTVGQEESLYADAVVMSEKLARPFVSYDISVINLTMDEKYADEEFKLAQNVRIYDQYTGLNEYGVVEKMILYPLNPASDVVTVASDLSDVANRSLASILERVTEISEQTRRNREIYERAVAISKSGTFNSAMLEGAIDVLRTKLSSTSSNWYTDEKGNIIFEAVDGGSAMMMCGAGFMIANSKTEGGAWNWRTFGTGDGFTADMIITGYLSSERIEAGSITVNHLASSVGEELDISSNKGITIAVADAVEDQLASFEVDPDSIVAKIINDPENVNEIAEAALTSDAFDVKIENSQSFSEIKQTADRIYLLITDGSSEAKIEFTQAALDAMADDINLSANHTMTFNADQLTQIANNINLSANNTVTITADKINAIADDIDLSTNNTININAAMVQAVINDVDISSNSFAISVSNTAQNALDIANSSISNVEEQYYVSTTTDAPSDSATWDNEIPEWESGTYLWIRTVTTYKNGATNFTTPYMDDTWSLTNQILSTANEGLSTAEVALNTAKNAVYQNEFERVIRIDTRGLHVGDNLTTSEVLIDSATVNIVVNGITYSTFGPNFLQLGDDIKIRRPSVGGIAFSPIKE